MTATINADRDPERLSAALQARGPPLRAPDSPAARAVDRRAVAARHRQHAGVFHAAAGRREAARPLRRRQSAVGRGADAVRARVRGPLVCRRDRLANRRRADWLAQRCAASKRCTSKRWTSCWRRTSRSFTTTSQARSPSARLGTLAGSRTSSTSSRSRCWANAVPLAFVTVVLWSYSPLLIVASAGHAVGDARHDSAAHPAAPEAGRRSRGGLEQARRARGRLDRQRRNGARLRPRARRGARSMRRTSETTAPRRSDRGTTRTCASTR